MKFESIIIKVTNTMRLRGFTTQTQKTYMNCITNYLKFLKQKSTKPCSESAKEYLLKLNLLGKDSNTIKVHSAFIRFLLLLYFKVSSSLIISKKVEKYSLYIGRSNTFVFYLFFLSIFAEFGVAFSHLPEFQKIRNPSI